MAYVRLRSPGRSGQSLDVPGDGQVDSLWAANLQLRSKYPADMVALAKNARQQFLETALCYSRRYLPQVGAGLVRRCERQSVVMSGHQPSLFHPVVWYKNFRLDALANRFDAIGVNLVVDNDLLVTPSVGCPRMMDAATSSPNDGSTLKTAAVEMLRFDSPAATAPYEQRPLVDEIHFADFSKTVTKSVISAFGSRIGSPVIERLWPEVLAAKKKLGIESLGAVIAAGRHRLEWQLGLRTLEVPVSQIAGTPAFGEFAKRIFSEMEHFRAIYNSVLRRYRQRHGIRSLSHPVPELLRSDSWEEAPFWVWTLEDPQRRPLFVEAVGDRLRLSDLRQFSADVTVGDFERWWNAMVCDGDVRIRPRALTTTMYHRLLVSDLFIHGIGGAKYDQLTDQIIAEFFLVPPPKYLTSTATFRLPFDQPRVTPADISRQKQLLRDLLFHPENHVPKNTQTNPLIQRKQLAIGKLKEYRRLATVATQDVGSIQQPSPVKLAHNEIQSINAGLNRFLVGRREEVATELQRQQQQLRTSEVLFSREYSFALHSDAIIGRLKTLAAGGAEEESIAF